jgi:predicted acetyltransferase
MPLEVRAITEDELPAMLEVDRRGFGAGPRLPEMPESWVRAQLDRTRCAFDGGEMSGCSRAYAFELTMPGGALVPVSAVSAVAVQPSHRRRGVLSQMLEALRVDAIERGEVAAALTASESAIYGRFGYGVATWQLWCAIDRAHAAFARPLVDAGRVRMLTNDEALKLFPDVYERCRRLRAGMVSRPDYWWPEVYWAEPSRVFFDVLHEDAHGEPDGFASYELTGGWDGGHTNRRLTVWDLQATNATARAALWHYLLGIDLVATILGRRMPVDEPLRLLLADPRRLRAEAVNDNLWVLPLDIPALLAARAYAAPGRVVIEVDGERCEVDAGGDGVTATRSKRSADLVCSRATLGAASLGGNSWFVLADAGLVDEESAGALRRADAMFTTIPAPATLSWF